MRQFLLPILVVLTAGCAERELPTPSSSSEALVIETHDMPAYLNPGSRFTVAVRVRGATAATRVTVTIQPQGGSSGGATHPLYDDGGALHPEGGDVVAFDGVYSNRLGWEPEQNSRQEYVFRFRAEKDNGEAAEPLEVMVVSLDNVPPRILLLDLPDFLTSGFSDSLRFSVQVSDSNGVEDIAAVSYRGIRDGITLFQGELQTGAAGGPSGERVFELWVTSTFAVGKKGVYRMEFVAVDRSGAESAPASRDLDIGNTAPQLSAFFAPSSLARPAQNTIDFPITVSVSDSQSLADIQWVKLDWRKPDGSYPSGSPYELFDNGLPYDFSRWNQGYRGDAQAGDGVYTITGVFDADDAFVDYLLTVYAQDLAGNRSEVLRHTITLNQDGK